MSRLLLYTDLSPSRPWLFASIDEHRDLLQQNNIILAPFYPWSKDIYPAHYEYWASRKEDAGLPAWLKKALNTVKKHLDNGKDVLLFGTSRDPEGHKALQRLLQPILKLGQHQCQSLFVIGRPVCLLEQKWLNISAKTTLVGKMNIVRQHASIAGLVSHNQQLWGKENVSLLPDFSENVHVSPQSQLVSDVFTWLQCPLPEKIQPPLEHPFYLASWPARKLFAARMVRWNRWPEMDCGAYIETLKAVEKDWPRRLATPLSFRKILEEEGREDRLALEEMCNAPSGSFSCPDWLATEPENEGKLCLTANHAETLVQALPEHICHALLQRLTNDAPILSADQKILAQALQQNAATVSHIGEPVPPPTISVLTMTYNQEKYIAQCMDSVLTQKTDFPVQHIVVDHHSDDATPQIIAEYASRHTSIRPVLLSNHIPNENTRGLFARCRTKYASLCDGDDYFTDPLKLQKQVNYLEQNQDCALCAHPVRVVYDDGDSPEHIYPPDELLPLGPSAKYDIEHLLQGNMIQTNSVVYRWRFTEGLPTWFCANICPGDWYWHLLHAEIGHLGFLPDVMSVYRRHKKAIYHTTQISALEHRKVHGMAELKSYWAMNNHFKGKYFEDFARLAIGVFVNFLQHSIDTDDNSYLVKATTAFPDFGGYFLKEYNSIHGSADE